MPRLQQKQTAAGAVILALQNQERFLLQQLQLTQKLLQESLGKNNIVITSTRKKRRP